VLVATDIAARGIDVPDISHVINFDLPNIPESYVHRIGRTARAGRTGIAISFCDHEEREYLRDIEKLIKQRIPVAGEWRHAGSKPAPADPARRARHAEPANTRLEPQRPAKRNRPEPREAPGPYLPLPPKPPAQHGRRGHEPARHGRPHGGHKHRPATPHYVDPEQRRKPVQPHLDERDARTAQEPHWIPQQPSRPRRKHSHRR